MHVVSSAKVELQQWKYAHNSDYLNYVASLTTLDGTMRWSCIREGVVKIGGVLFTGTQRFSYSCVVGNNHKSICAFKSVCMVGLVLPK